MTPDVAAAAEAACAVAAEHGLVVDRVEVLSDGANAVLRLHPLPVVARVAAATTLVRPDPAAPLARELALAAHAAGRGAPVVPPSDLLPPGPYVRDRRVVGFWRAVEVAAGEQPGAVAAARALAALHDAVADAPVALPGPEEIAGDARRALDVPGTTWPAEQRAMLERAEELVAEVLAVTGRGGRHPLHGDGHGGNVLVTPSGLLWCDLEDAWAGPLEWDLAVLRRSRRLDGEAAFAAYVAETGVRPDATALDACLRLREAQVLAWPQLLDGARSGRLRTRLV